MTSEELAALDEKIAAANKVCKDLDDVAAGHAARLSAARNAEVAARRSRDALVDIRDAPRREAARMFERSLIEGRSGPMRPVGDRTVRTSCAVAEVPPTFGDDSYSGCLFGVDSGDGHKWIACGHFLIRVDSLDGVKIRTVELTHAMRPSAFRLVREDVPVWSTDEPAMWLRSFGSERIQLKYSSLVEDLFPAVEWWSTGGELGPVNACVNGELVAVVMPVRT